jgi:hypothetical protein
MSSQTWYVNYKRSVIDDELDFIGAAYQYCCQVTKEITAIFAKDPKEGIRYIRNFTKPPL